MEKHTLKVNSCLLFQFQWSKRAENGAGGVRDGQNVEKETYVPGVTSELYELVAFIPDGRKVKAGGMYAFGPVGHPLGDLGDGLRGYVGSATTGKDVGVDWDDELQSTLKVCICVV